MRNPLEVLREMIFGDGKTVPKNPKLYRQEKPSKHWGSKKRRHEKKIRAAQKRARASRKRNRRG
jgi:hypothetical protein